MNKEQIRKVRQVYRAIVLLEQQYESEFGLNLNEAVTLCHLSDTDGMTTGEMAETLQLTNSNTSKVMSSVEKMGYVRRKIDKEDKRSMHFMLTTKGRELVERMHCCDILLPEIFKPLINDVSHDKV